MADPHSMGNEFLTEITQIIEENLSDERFGVSELAREAGMSRSNLLRKVKKLTERSVSQFIRQIRLEKAMEILKENSHTVSEVSYKVGFGSTSYFIKCFHAHYGYSPGEVGKRALTESTPPKAGQSGKKRSSVLLGAIGLVLITFVLLVIFNPFSSKSQELEKSIAVLPFKNDSDDSTNVYLINGLMESILDNLQKMEGLRVISRTSVEKYRDHPKTIPEIARELNVSYFVEGSGQKIGDQILLSIQLIEGPSDTHLWAEQYNKEAKDVFKLQREIAKNIADKIQVIITPEEEEIINKPPTDNLVAYDYFLKGLDSFYKGSRENLEEAIRLFEKATEHDPEFARAYADIAISYFSLDNYQAEKKYSDQINSFADKALLIDSKLPQSLVAKAFYYIQNEQYELAVPYLEKALHFNPNSALVINILSDFYANYVPNAEKYLEYALKGIGLDIAAHDSIEASFIYLHVSNAFIQSGFTDEAEKYIDQSLAYYPENLYSAYVKAFILYAKNRDLLQTKELLLKALNKDATRYDIIQEVGKICYYMRDYESAYVYYKKFIEIKEALNLDVYKFENAKIGLVLSEMGLTEESEEYLSDYKDYAESDESIYKHLSLAVYHSFTGSPEKSIEQLRLFSQQENYHYWTILFLKIDPLIDSIKDLPEFKKILDDMETKFWNNHRRIRSSLEAEGLI